MAEFSKAGKMNNKNHMFMLDVATYLEIVELAKKHGKKPGDGMDEELVEVMKKKGNIEYLGPTDKDLGLITGNLRENGYKILNINEELRRRAK